MSTLYCCCIPISKRVREEYYDLQSNFFGLDFLEQKYSNTDKIYNYYNSCCFCINEEISVNLNIPESTVTQNCCFIYKRTIKGNNSNEFILMKRNRVMNVIISLKVYDRFQFNDSPKIF